MPEGYEKGRTLFSPAQALTLAGAASATVFYRDGGEVVKAVLEKGEKGEPAHGLSTSGESAPFSPQPSSTLPTASWPGDAGGQKTVEAGCRLGCSIPEKSHCEVSFCCFVVRGRPKQSHTFHTITGYHGEFTIDPVNGTVLRVAGG